MNPNNLVLTKLAGVCDKLAKSGHLTAAEAYDEWRALILQSSDPSSPPDLLRHLEAHAEDLAARMVDILEGQLFPAVQVEARLAQKDNPDLDFRAVEIPGEPLSATILRERR